MCLMENTDQEHTDSKKTIYADVIIDISHEALDKVFQYRVPFSIAEDIKPGVKVIVPFGRGNRETAGYVISLSGTTDYDHAKIKEVSRVDEESLTVESELIRVAAFLKHTYGGSMIQALRTVMPVKNKMKPRTRMTLRLALERAKTEELLESWEKKHFLARARLLKALLAAGSLEKKTAMELSGLPLKELRKLADKGILTLEEEVACRSPFSGMTRSGDRVQLNEEQQVIVDEFREDQDGGSARTYLLHGVTGSGKTEVYLALIEEVLARGRTAIVLIPEISLTYQTVSRFYDRFGDRIALLNSRLSKGEKFDEIRRIMDGKADVVIGPRSALFAPLSRLGLIIIDEEHDGAYKSELTPKYHATETAIYRAGLCGASVVLGSATPLTETYDRALAGRYHLWKMVRRAGGANLPDTEIVDLRQEFMAGNRSMFSGKLKEAIADRLARGEQTMLFLNRRGFAGFVSCRSCGAVMKCPHCDVSLTSHRDGTLRCHYCGYERKTTKICPVCNSAHMAAFGLGTEKVEAALATEFPTARVIRMDADTTRKKHAHQELLKLFEEGKADILVGTQMIVKGHDYPNVTLVGIMAADMTLHGSDFRSAETTFALLCQAAGRAGRGDKPGQVIIQTYSPDHYAIRTAADQSYEEFYRNEIAYRAMMHYPPRANMLAILIQSGDKGAAVLAAARIEKMISRTREEQEDPVRVLGPGEARIAKIKDIHRQIIYLKHRSGELLLDLKERLEPVLESHPMFAGVTVQFDYNPMTFY